MYAKVSIVIPVYNGADFMREAIDSALNQTYPNCEIIVVNDGSTDETGQIALSYGKRIRYFAKENGGVSTALNLGIENMEGEYFSWLSHDDVYYPYKIEKQMRALQQNTDRHALVYSNWNQLQMPEGIVRPAVLDCRYRETDYQRELRPVFWGLINGCTTLIHKSHFERVGLFDETLLTAQDYDMWFRMFRNQNVLYINEPLVKYRIHEKQGSATIAEFSKNCEDIQRKMIQEITKEEIERLFGGYYRFYYYMLRIAEENQWKKLLEQLLGKFENTEEPEQELPAKKNIVLYCAGKNGRRLKDELFLRGIDIDKFSDGNSELWGKTIDGIVVEAPDLIEKDAFIIVTKDNPGEVVSMLKKNGYINVKTYSEILEWLYDFAPAKERVISYYRKMRGIRDENTADLCRRGKRGLDMDV